MALTFVENTALHHSRALALTDELTGLANRRLFHERLNAALGDGGDAPLAVAMVDLDRFKELNDTLGHHAGDRLLSQLGPRLQDVVGDAGLVARLGGDEFALLLPETDADDAQEAVERIVEALAGDSVLADGLGISFGLALFPVHGKTPEELIRRADQALYAAKRSDDDLHFAPRAA
jgi:diguanylate cyclase (GGDEF)-like protein